MKEIFKKYEDYLKSGSRAIGSEALEIIDRLRKKDAMQGVEPVGNAVYVYISGGYKFTWINRHGELCTRRVDYNGNWWSIRKFINEEGFQDSELNRSEDTYFNYMAGKIVIDIFEYESKNK